MIPVSELLAVKIENVCLKLTQLQQQGQQFYVEQQRLIEAARTEVSAPIGHVYNTDTRQFQPPLTSLSSPPFRAPAARQAKRARQQ